jgi:ketosteroid isomerase-like protein
MEKVSELSSNIWDAIQNEKADVLVDLVHPEACFVHMGVTLSRDGEIEVIKEGVIIYKEIDFQESTIKDMGATVILLNKLELTAVVNGNEVTNPFVVTEVYTKNGDELKLASMSYTRINY